jgi:multidrug efflux pump subunit AcrA (membrane-fusion protein)
MDINQLRGWAAFMDKAMIASLIATILAVGALGITTWLSFRFSGALRTREQAVLAGYKGAEGHSLQLERDVATARERVSTLEQEVATARERTAALEQQVTAARQQTATKEQEASAARDRAEASSRAAREANEHATRADRETAEAAAKERALELDAAEIRQRLAELGQQVRKAAEQTSKPAEQATKPAESTPEGPAPAGDKPASLVVESLRKFAGTKAAVFVIDQVSDAPAAGATISTDLSEAGWESQTWKWTGVAGIFGVVVLVKDGSDAATNEAASTLVEQLRANAFSATKGDWPANWRLYRGTLDGPQTPAPTDAPIRIVIGVKPR